MDQWNRIESPGVVSNAYKNILKAASQITGEKMTVWLTLRTTG